MIARIQMRRGQFSQMNPSKLLPGEFGVALDEKKLYLCFSPGDIKEVQFAENFESSIYDEFLELNIKSVDGEVYLCYKDEIISDGIDVDITDKKIQQALGFEVAKKEDLDNLSSNYAKTKNEVETARAGMSSIGRRFDEIESGERIKNVMPYYPIATEKQARAGTEDTVMMTPLKVAMAIDELGGGSGGGSTNVATMSSSFEGGSFAYGQQIEIRYRWSSPAEGNGTLHVIIDSLEYSQESVAQGVNRAVINDLEKGAHTITMYVVDGNGDFTDTLTFQIRIGTLDISSTFDDSVDFNIVNVIRIPITVDTISLDTIYLIQTIDGVETRTTAINGYNLITLPTMSAGAHKVSFYAESGTYKSQTLSYNVVIEDADNLTLITDFTTQTIQYRDILEFPYRVSLKGQVKFVAEYSVDGVVIKTLEISAGTNVWSTNTLDLGTHTLRITVSTVDGSKSEYIEKTVIVEARDYTPLTPVQDASLLCWFDATGKTNQDIDKETWEDKSGNDVQAIMHNFNYSTNGWGDNALKCNGQAYVEIDLQALADDAPYGMTVEVKYNTRDVGHQDACVLDMRGNDAYNKGFAIDTENMYLNSSATKISSSVEQDSVSNAAFVIDRDNQIAKIYNNGVLSETFLMTANENFANTTKIYLNAKLESDSGKWVPSIFGNCEIYSIRVYARALESDEIVHNMIADIADMDEQQEKYLLNYENAMPTMYFYGDTSAMTKDNKVPLRIRYISGDANEYGASFDLENCQVSWQGTSSLQYAVKNYKIRLKNPDGSKYKYTPFKNGILEDTFCLKADYMESSHANNTGMAKFINNELYDSKIPPQLENENVRSTINGFPIQLYIARDSGSTPEYIGIFNFNLDKGCTDSFGLDNEIEGFENCVSFEVSSNSDTSAGAFKDDSDTSLRTDFELRYPDEDDCTDEQITEKYTTLKRLVTWVKNCTEETFEAELEQYFSKEYLLKYFLQVHLFGMVDNLGKNMMLTTWDGLVWYPEFYDMDTQLGLDNTGYLRFYSDIDVAQGTYNTSGSKLWTMVQTVFADDLAEMYKTMRATKYRPETILSYWYDEQVAKIGELQYNKDMEAKYIKFKNDYLFMLHGRRSEHMKKWIKERLLYLDTIYGYEEDTRDSITIRANTTSTINLDILTYSPQYLTVRWRNGVEQRLKIGRDANGMMTSTRFSGTLATATDQEIIIYNAKQIKKIDGLANTNPSVLNLVEASRLTEINCQNAKVLNDIRLSSNNRFLSYLNLYNCTTLGDSSSGKSSSLDLSYLDMLAYVNVSGSKLTNLIFPTTGCNLEELYAECDNMQTLTLQNMPLLSSFITSPHAAFSNFAVLNCPNAVMQVNWSAVNNVGSRTSVYIAAEDIDIEGSPKIFNSSPEKVIINCNTGVCGVTTTIPKLDKLVMKGIEYKIPLLKIVGEFLDTGTQPTISNFEIDADIEIAMFTGIGFKQQVESLNMDLSKVDYLLMKKFTNIKSLNLSSNMKGLYLGKVVVSGITDSQLSSNGVWANAGTAGSSTAGSEFEDASYLEELYMDGMLITDTLDFSDNPKMGVLVLDDDVIPSAINKVILNCDFTTFVRDDLLNSANGYTQFQFYLPATMTVEGELKTTDRVKGWRFYGAEKTVVNDAYPTQEDYSNLNWDFSEHYYNFGKLFDSWRSMRILPNGITPDMFGRSETMNTEYMFCNCTSLESLGALDGGDITVTTGTLNDSCQYMFNNVACEFSIGTFTFVNGNANGGYSVRYLFNNSGITSIDNFILARKDGNTAAIMTNSIFRDCTKLTHVGTIDITNAGTTHQYAYPLERMFSGCSNLEQVEDFYIPDEYLVIWAGMFSSAGSNVTNPDFSGVRLPNNSNLGNMFSGSGLTDITTLQNYQDAIRTATDLGNMFNGSKITSVPNLTIETDASCSNMFQNCKSLETVGEITFTGNPYSLTSMFNGDTALKTIEKFDAPNCTTGLASVFFGVGDASYGKFAINYFDVTGTTSQPKGNNIINTFALASGVKGDVIFHGDIGTFIAISSYFYREVTLESLQSFVSCALTLDEPFTLGIGAANFAKMTEEMLATMATKNWTITA